MAKTVADVMKMVKDNEIKFVDFRFTDTRGKEHHVSVPVSHFDEDKFIHGHAFDGSSIAGWKGIEASDMQLMPDPNTANIDPFFEESTLFLQCDVVEPSDGKAYDRDPRSIARRAPAEKGRAMKARRIPRFVRLTARAFLLVQPLKIIPAPVILTGVCLAEIPALLAVGRFGCRAIPPLFAAMPIAQAHLLRRAV